MVRKPKQLTKTEFLHSFYRHITTAPKPKPYFTSVGVYASCLASCSKVREDFMHAVRTQVTPINVLQCIDMFFVELESAFLKSSPGLKP